jgi:hypothetical protein
VTNTYKFEVQQYAPLEEYRLRVSYDRAVRAPTVAELYTPPIVGLAQIGNDPCAPPIVYTLAQCERTHVTADQQHRLLPHQREGRGGGVPLPGHIVELRQYRRPDLLQPDRAPAHHHTLASHFPHHL